MADQVILLPSEAPPPLEIYEHEYTHPDNAALLKARLERFQPLPRAERRRLEKRRQAILKTLRQAHFELDWAQRAELHELYRTTREEFNALRRVMDAAWQAETALEAKRAAIAADVPAYRRIKARLRYLIDRGSFLSHRLEPLTPLYHEMLDINHRLNEHERMLLEQQQQREEERRYREESKIIESLMLGQFAKTKGCHFVWYDSRGRRCVDLPRFQVAGIDADSHWFLLAASEKGRFGWRSVLPYSVNIEDLTSESTLDNLSVAVGRQVEVRRNDSNTQIYFRVNRLDSPDGLPKYFAFKSMFTLYPESEREAIPFPVGVFENRRVRFYNLKECHHIIVSGSSGAGKSNCLNAILSTLIQTHSPDEVQLVLIDMKGGVELSWYEDVPHLVGEYIHDLKRVLGKLRETRKILDARLNILRNAGYKEIFSYNAGVDSSKRLPQLVIVFDEMATLLNRGKWTRAVHHYLAEIASLGRAPGVTLILCTQHPSKEVIPMTIKTNANCLFTFKMPAHASMTILGDTSAATLPDRVPGRCLVLSGLNREHAQTPHISDDDIREAVRYSIRRWGAKTPALPAEVPTTEADTEPVKTFAESPDYLVIPPRFTEEDLIAIAIHNFDGVLHLTNIFDSVKQTGLISRGKLSAMIKALVPKRRIEFEDMAFEIERYGKMWRLVAVAPQFQSADIPETITPDAEAESASIMWNTSETIDHPSESKEPVLV